MMFEIIVVFSSKVRFYLDAKYLHTHFGELTCQPVNCRLFGRTLGVVSFHISFYVGKMFFQCYFLCRILQHDRKSVMCIFTCKIK